MKDYLPQIKSIFHLSTSKRESYQRRAIKPAQDWMLLFLFTVVFLVVVGVAAFYFYVQVNNGELFVVPLDETQHKTKIDMPLLNKTIEDINARASQMEAAQAGSVTAPDPSL